MTAGVFISIVSAVMLGNMLSHFLILWVHSRNQPPPPLAPDDYDPGDY